MDPLRTHRVILCDQLDVGKIIPYLRQDRMLTSDEYSTLTNPIYNIKQRRNKLLDMMPRKGRRYFEHFGKNLVWSGQKDLARHIGVDVDKVPDSPHVLDPEPDPQNPYEQMLKLFGSTHTSGQYPTPQPPYNPSYPHPQPPPPSAPMYPQPVPPHGQPATSTSTPMLRPIIGDSKVFILYCKDDSIPGITADEWADDILGLADVFTQCGKIVCTLDRYEKNYPANWDKWTLDRINESNFVVLVLSPKMAQGMQCTQRRSLPMAIGQFYCDSVYNVTQAPLFVPVFLNKCAPSSGNIAEWIPPNLAMARSFRLPNFADLVNGYEQGTGNEADESSQFLQYLQRSFADPRFSSMAELVGHLRGESGVERPSPPSAPVTLPQQTYQHPVQATSSECRAGLGKR